MSETGNHAPVTPDALTGGATSSGAGFVIRHEVDALHPNRRARRRYRGQSTRGRPSRAQEHAKSVRLAIASCQRALEQLRVVNAMPDDCLGDHRARSHEHSLAVAQVALAARLLDEVVIQGAPR